MLQLETSFAVVENVEGNGETSRARDDIRENIKISAKEIVGYCE
jgi:hypothetical protein